MAAPAFAVKAVKSAAALFATKKGRKKLGWIFIFLLSPVILAIMILFMFLQAGTKHNSDIILLCFYGGEQPAYTPTDYNDYIRDMQKSFQLLDEQISKVNADTEGRGLDSVRIKSVFFSLYFGLESPSKRDHKKFVECFVVYEERTREVEVEVKPATKPPTYKTVTETYTVAVPIQSLDTCYANIASSLGITATTEQRTNAMEIYLRIAGHGDGDYGYDPSMPFVGIDGFVSPVGSGWRNMVTSEFGWRNDPFTQKPDFHRGIDFAGSTGHPIYSVLDGRVIAVGTDPNSSFGYYVKIDHGGEFVTLYAHNSSVLVTSGQQVTAGQQIAGMGNSGRVTGTHLHFEIQVGGELQDARLYLP